MPLSVPFNFSLVASEIQAVLNIQMEKSIWYLTPNLAGGERTVPVPIVGSVPCGGLALADEDVEGYVDISTMLAKPSGRYFILRAKGDSMDLSGINDGDLVLIRQLPTANDGDRVVALVNDEATIKHFHREKGMVVPTTELLKSAE
jgi:SOS-response transcriptional repressor LexA